MTTPSKPIMPEILDDSKVHLYFMEVVPYDEPIYWSWAPTRELYKEEVERTLPFLTVAEVPDNVRAHCDVYFYDKYFYPIIWVSDPDDPSLLAHELVHYVHWLLARKGMSFTDESEEAYAYLTQFLMRFMLENRRSDRYPPKEISTS